MSLVSDVVETTTAHRCVADVSVPTTVSNTTTAVCRVSRPTAQRWPWPSRTSGYVSWLVPHGESVCSERTEVSEVAEQVQAAALISGPAERLEEVRQENPDLDFVYLHYRKVRV